MRTARWLGATALLFSGVWLAAQQAGVSAQQSVSAGSRTSESAGANASTQAHPRSVSAGGAAAGSATAGHSNTSTAAASGGAYSVADMRTVSGQLESKLDSKSARVGDPVVLKTRQKMKTADGTVIPKGTRLMGHVTSVQAHDAAHAQSELGLVFDRAELKNGQSIVIDSTIRSIEPPVNAFADDSMAEDDSLAAPAGGSVVGGGRAGGGLIGGGGVGGGRLVGGAPLAGAMNTAGSATAQTGAGLTGAADGTMHSAGDVAGHAAGNLDAETRAAGGAGGGLAAHATGLPGVMLQGGASDSLSGMLSASRKNVHLDSGTQMELGIVTPARQ